ncbi:SET domain-containing protein [Nannocystis sp.]|uniref:SET domain-containing protein n=1 Tax=Nannocystis sp. TaxID=1962667 RepID=UPI0025EDE63E|nr:SET domain-containing protein [Nannocystis sp.]MBK7826347.1 SET domain-containing protein [Nannocystis sp.]
MQAVAQDPAVARLIAWIVAAGGRVGSLRVGPARAGRGVFATAPIAEGELLLALPRACLLTPECAADTAFGRTIAAEWRGPSHDQILLAALLVARDDPMREAYRDSLPARLPGLPLYYDPAEAEALCSTSLALRMGERHAQIVEEFAWLRAKVPGMGSLDAPRWFHARAQVGSRCFFLGELHGEALVPLADLLNHAPQPNTGWQLDARGDFVLRAVRPLAAGAELHHSYGEISNARLLLNYGFTEADNPARACSLELPGHGEVMLAAGDGGDADGAVDPSALQALRARVGSGADLRLRAACSERLARLPQLAGDSAAFADLRRVVDDERRVLAAWLAALAQ